MAQTQTQLTQLTLAIQQMVGQNAAPAAAVPQAPVAPATAGPPPDPDFDWTRLYQEPQTTFPTGSEGQVQHLAAGLLAKLPMLTGRDHHEVAFLLTVTSEYEDMEPRIQNAVFQRLNILYIATHHGWSTAIAASAASTSSVASFPPGFVLPAEPRARRPTVPAPAPPAAPAPQAQQPARGNRPGRRRGRN